MNTLIISPSGDFYGSEQVLHDYLEYTDHEFHVAVNQRGILLKKLKKLKSVIYVIGFDHKRLKQFYFKIFLSLLSNRYSKVYWNEGGHMNYCILLAKLFPFKEFVVHIRIIEDTDVRRWILRPTRNISLISVSKYIQDNLKFSSKLIYDPYAFKSGDIPNMLVANEGKFRIGIIGRVTFSKGIDGLVELIECIRKRGLESYYIFYLIGDISPDVLNSSWLEKMEDEPLVSFSGFLGDKTALYDSIDCVLHFSKQEALGRIFLESLDAGLPFVGIDSGGIGEIGALAGMNLYLANAESEDIPAEVLNILELVRGGYTLALEDVRRAKQNISTLISLPNYINALDKELIS